MEYLQDLNYLKSLGFDSNKTYIIRGLEHDDSESNSILEIYYIWEEFKNNQTLSTEYKLSHLRIHHLDTNLKYVSKTKVKKDQQISNFKIQNNEIFRVDDNLSRIMKDVPWDELFYISSMFKKTLGTDFQSKKKIIKDNFDFLGKDIITKTKKKKENILFKKRFDGKEYKTIKNFNTVFNMRIIKKYVYNHTLIFEDLNSQSSEEEEEEDLDKRILKIFVKYLINPWTYLYIRTKYKWSTFLNYIYFNLVDWFSKNQVFSQDLLELIQILLSENILDIDEFSKNSLNDYNFLIAYSLITKIYSGENWISKSNFSKISSNTSMTEYLNVKNFYQQKYISNREILYNVATQYLLKIQSLDEKTKMSFVYGSSLFNSSNLFSQIDTLLSNVYKLFVTYKKSKLPLGNLKIISIQILQEMINLQHLKNDSKKDMLNMKFLERNLKFFNKLISKDSEQKNAVLGALNNPISIISGGAGTGKSELIVEIIKQLKKHFPEESEKIKIVTPTGKAAFNLRTRLNGVGMGVKTIHSFLKSSYSDSFQTLPISLGEDYETLQILIIDEFGMVNNKIFLDLLYSFNRSNFFKLILVGDKNQVPPIEYGDILNDFYDLDYFPNFELKTNHRTKDGGKIIIDYANKLLNREVPDFLDTKAYVSLGNWTDYDVSLNFFQSELLKIKKNYVNDVLKGTQNKYEDWENDLYNEFAIITHTNNDVDLINNVFQEIRFLNKKYYRLGGKKFSETKFRRFEELEQENLSQEEKKIIKRELIKSNLLLHPGEKMIILKNVSIEISSKEVDEIWVKNHKTLDDNQEIYHNPFNNKKYLKTYIRFFNGEIVYFLKANRNYERIKTSANEKLELEEENNLQGYSQIVLQKQENGIWNDVVVDFENLMKSQIETWNEFLTVGYCGTIHKYQGSEYNQVYVAINSKTINYWDVRLLYTAITRAKNKLIIINNREDNIEKIVLNGKKSNNTYIKRNLTPLLKEIKKWEIQSSKLKYCTPDVSLIESTLTRLVRNLFDSIFYNLSDDFEEVYQKIIKEEELEPNFNIKLFNIKYLIDISEDFITSEWDLEIIDYLKTKQYVMSYNIFEDWVKYIENKIEYYKSKDIKLD